MNPIKKLATTEKPTEAGRYLWWWSHDSLFPSSELAIVFYDYGVLKVVFGSMERRPCQDISDKGMAGRLWLKVSD